ncbi:MAG: DNA lyase [Candidatus Aenigmarchaeota archaeon]|nr:DNA lyase [Candidatus Aenigmarchaeota archaeon]
MNPVDDILKGYEVKKGEIRKRLSEFKDVLNQSEQVRPFLQAVRFADNKSKYLVAARKLFSGDGRISIKDKLSETKNDPVLLRDWLLDNVKGLGMKATSHFIRNIGLTKNQLAILDVHILKNLKEFGVIDEIPKSLTKKRYLEIEARMKKFADRLGIMLDELDLLLWSKETGVIFK